MNELTLHPESQQIENSTHLPAINPAELAERRRLVNEVLRSQMQEEVHFGKKAGGSTNKKNVLYKAGAELLANTFMLGVNPHVENLSDDEEVHYRVTCELIHLPTNRVVGRGLGECSSHEEKYAWRRATGPGEFDYTPKHRRRTKWKYDYNNNREYNEMQVRADPQDKANTILKMAKKRAFVDAVQTTLGVSDMFADPNETEEDVKPRKNRQAAPPPNATPYPEHTQDNSPAVDMSGKINEHMLKTLQRTINLRMPDVDDVAELCRTFGVNELTELPAAKVNEALEWIYKRRRP